MAEETGGRRDDEVHATSTTVTNSGAGGRHGKRPSTAPSVAGDIVFYTTTNEAATTPCADFTAKLYAVTYVGRAAYDSNGNGKIDNNESRRRQDDGRARDRAVHRRPAPVSSSTAEPAAAAPRSSAIPRTSTTASGEGLNRGEERL